MINNGVSIITYFQGVTGEINFMSNSRNPVKSAVILQIKNGALVWFVNVNPFL